MATNFPGSLDSFTNPSSSSTLDSPSHAAQHANINDAMQAVQAKLGVGAGTIGTWQTWSPSLTGFTATTTYARYMKVNDFVVCEGDFVLTGTPTATMGVTWPVEPSAANYQWNRISCGGSYAYDISLSSATACFVARLNTFLIMSNANVSNVVGPTVPFTWVTGDVFVIRAMYEAA